MALGRPAEAEDLASSALRTSASLDALTLSHAAHHTLARVAEAGAQPSHALDEYEAAVRDLERIAQSLVQAVHRGIRIEHSRHGRRVAVIASGF